MPLPATPCLCRICEAQLVPDPKTAHWAHCPHCSPEWVAWALSAQEPKAEYVPELRMVGLSKLYQ